MADASATSQSSLPASVADTLAMLGRADYVADRSLATAVHLALHLKRPLFLEGEAGVGKTAAALALARILDTPLIRLQCYEGIDAAEALYEWNYPRQLLSIRLAEASGSELSEGDLFGPTVNLASRLVAMARPRTVLVSDSLGAELEGAPALAVRHLRAMPLQGIGRVRSWVLRRADVAPPPAPSKRGRRRAAT